MMPRQYVYLNNAAALRSEPRIHRFLTPAYAKDGREVVMRGGRMERAIIDAQALDASTTLNRAAAAVDVDPAACAHAVEFTAGLSSVATLTDAHLLAPAPLFNDWDEV